jgi:uncharacterized protein with FMN-binding domain
MSKKNITIIFFVAVIAAGLLFFASNQSQNTDKNVSNSSTSTIKSKSDGIYTINQSYKVPGGETEKITATVEIKNGVISSVKSSGSASNGQSKEYQASFGSSVSSAAVGNKIDELKAPSIGGASLTTKAFYSGLANI